MARRAHGIRHVKVNTGGPAAVGRTKGFPQLAEELAGWDTDAVAGKWGKVVEEDTAAAPRLLVGEYLRHE